MANYGSHTTNRRRSGKATFCPLYKTAECRRLLHPLAYTTGNIQDITYKDQSTVDGQSKQ